MNTRTITSRNVIGGRVSAIARWLGHVRHDVVLGLNALDRANFDRPWSHEATTRANTPNHASGRHPH